MYDNKKRYLKLLCQSLLAYLYTDNGFKSKNCIFNIFQFQLLRKDKNSLKISPAYSLLRKRSIYGTRKWQIHFFQNIVMAIYEFCIDFIFHFVKIYFISVQLLRVTTQMQVFTTYRNDSMMSCHVMSCIQT